MFVYFSRVNDAKQRWISVETVSFGNKLSVKNKQNVKQTLKQKTQAIRESERKKDKCDSKQTRKGKINQQTLKKEQQT